MKESSNSKTRVAVTGAGGLVGSHIVEHLLSKDYEITAIIHSDKSRKLVESLAEVKSPTILLADLLDSRSLDLAFANADVVIHAAGLIDPYGDRKLIFATNVEGTGNALAAAKKSGVKHFIYISSLSVITAQKDQFNVSELVEPKLCGEAYADSKLTAEKIVINEAGAGAIKTTILRPGFIYGPRESSWMPRLIESITLGKAMLIDGGKRETNVIYVGNLNRATELSILNPKAFGQIFNLTDGQHVTKKQLFDAISEGLNLPPVSRTIPRAIAAMFCNVVSFFAHFAPLSVQKKLARYSPAAFRLVAVNQGFDISKAERELDYVDRISFQEGMRHTLSYFKEQSQKMTLTKNRDNEKKDTFLVDYCRRHNHPVNAVLHILGVPAVLVGLFFIAQHRIFLGIALILVGYFLQYLGHKTQGNEVGEVTLIKNVWNYLRSYYG